MKINKGREIEKLLGYEFLDKSLLETAIDTTQKQITQFDQLELVGDGFLQGCIGMLLTELGYSEEEASLGIKILGSNQNLADTVKKLEWDQFFTLHQEDTKTLGDVFEALIGAIALDTGGDLRMGMEIVRQLYTMLWADIPIEKDPITKLKELKEKRKLELITTSTKTKKNEYQTEIKSPSGEVISLAQARSKKESSKKASALAVESLDKPKKEVA